MIHSLVLRLLASLGEDCQLDTDILVWAETQVAFTDATHLPHCFGLTGNMSGAARFAAFMLPDVVFSFEWDPGARRASVTAHVGDDPRPVAAKDLANALLAATLAVFARGALEADNDSGNAALALQRLA